jgi:hypothetical protein
VVATAGMGAVARAFGATCGKCGTDAADTILLGQLKAGGDCIAVGSATVIGGASRVTM